MQEAAYWILFQNVFGCGTARSQKVLDHFGHPGAIFDIPYAKLAAEGSFTKGELTRLAAATSSAAQQVLDRCRELGCRVLTPADGEYPDRLRQIYAPPSVLYVLGSLEGLDQSLAIAMVGTRSHTSYGKRAASDIAEGLARRGVAVVSGLAAGIDADSHGAALRAGGRTIAVLGNGIDTIYPASNRELHRLILERDGAVITEFPPGSGVQPYHFPIRNRIISGLCQGTVVVEGARHSGSLITAGHALAQGRDVFAVPGNIYSPMSQATNWLISQGAVPVASWRDILEEYNYLIEEEPDPQAQKQGGFDNIEANVYNRQKGKAAKVEEASSRTAQQQMLPACLTENQRAVLRALEAEPADADTITARCGLPVGTVLAALTQLELFGHLKVHPGRRFSL